jgi:hypothetical protein
LYFIQLLIIYIISYKVVKLITYLRIFRMKEKAWKEVDQQVWTEISFLLRPSLVHECLNCSSYLRYICKYHVYLLLLICYSLMLPLLVDPCYWPRDLPPLPFSFCHDYIDYHINIYLYCILCFLYNIRSPTSLLMLIQCVCSLLFLIA